MCDGVFFITGYRRTRDFEFSAALDRVAKESGSIIIDYSDEYDDIK